MVDDEDGGKRRTHSSSILNELIPTIVPDTPPMRIETRSFKKNAANEYRLASSDHNKRRRAS